MGPSAGTWGAGTKHLDLTCQRNAAYPELVPIDEHRVKKESTFDLWGY